MNRRQMLRSVASMLTAGVVAPLVVTRPVECSSGDHVRNGWHVFWRNWVDVPNQLVSVGVWHAWRHESGGAVDTNATTHAGWESVGWAMPTTGSLHRTRPCEVLNVTVQPGWTIGGNLTAKEREQWKSKALAALLEAL